MTSALLATKPGSIGVDAAHAGDHVVPMKPGPYSHSIVPGGFDVTS
ncbi:MAG: hypothetical protein ACLQDM_15525 [Bradyrhizobium sp.]